MHKCHDPIKKAKMKYCWKYR